MKRNQLLIGGAALLAIVLLWYFVLYAPLGDDLSSAQAQRSTEEKKTSDLEANLARLQSQSKNSTEQQALLRKLDAAVPAQPDLAEFIIQANDIADQSGISFLSIAPSPPAAGTGVSVISLTMTIQGSFFQLQDYLRLLEQLERLVVVDGISVSASSASTGTASTETSTSSSSDTSLSVTLTGRMFTRAAPTSASGSTGGSSGTTTPTTTPAGGATSSTTAPATSSTTAGGT